MQYCNTIEGFEGWRKPHMQAFYATPEPGRVLLPLLISIHHACVHGMHPLSSAWSIQIDPESIMPSWVARPEKRVARTAIAGLILCTPCCDLSTSPSGHSYKHLQYCAWCTGTGCISLTSCSGSGAAAFSTGAGFALLAFAPFVANLASGLAKCTLGTPG